jgi:co-chaperonin GroES (HSP10)
MTMHTDIQPRNDHVFFRRDTVSRTLDSGIQLIEHKRSEPSLFGTVVAAGETAGVKVGERCLIGARGGQLIRHGGEELVVIKAENILAVCEE